MKRSVFVLLCILSSLCAQFSWASHMPTENDSWETILASKLVNVRDPNVQLHHEHGGLNTSVFNVCVDQDELKLESRVKKVCVRKSRPSRQMPAECVEYAIVEPASPIAFLKSVCTQWERHYPKDPVRHCVNWENRHIDYREPIEIAVSKLISDKPAIPPHRPGPVIFSKAYQIPSCAR